MSAKKIMIVDNEEGLCHMMEAVLMDEGHAVRSFTDPLIAVETFRPGTWDLVISDIKMPGIDGLEVLPRIKAGKPFDVFMAELEQAVETRSNELMAAAGFVFPK